MPLALVWDIDGNLPALEVVNSSSVSLPMAGDIRSTYLVIEGGQIVHRRVAQNVERVAADLLTIDYPHAATNASCLRSGVWPR
jgi:hypothetical protein